MPVGGPWLCWGARPAERAGSQRIADGSCRTQASGAGVGPGIKVDVSLFQFTDVTSVLHMLVQTSVKCCFLPQLPVLCP